MKFLLIPDKFKGSLSAEAVCQSLQEGLENALPDVECYPVLASDGGDGFLDAVARYRDVERVIHMACDPLGREIQASYLLDRNKAEAFIELAETSGLVLLQENERQAGKTSTLGTGLQIRHAMAEGARTVYVGLGGSATNDGGMGIAHALGYRFLDSEGEVLSPVGANLEKVESIEGGDSIINPKAVSLTAINDVNNPLYGPEGAAYVYAEQKGATATEIAQLDRGLRRFDRVVRRAVGKEVAQIKGCGAAGGTAYGLKAFFDADFQSGIQFILNLANMPELLARQPVDYILTGEGKIDRQTLHGKLIHGVLELGKAYDIPVVAVCGKLEVEISELEAAGLQQVLEIRDPEKSLQYNMSHAAHLLKEAVQRHFTK